MSATAFSPGAILMPVAHVPPQQGVAPPGWETTIKKMKKSGHIENPWALAWYMKHRGMKPARHEADAAYDVTLQQARAELHGRTMPQLCLAAGRGESYAITQLLQSGLLMPEPRR